jgi:hypothetical protein
MERGGFAVEAPKAAKPTSRWWYALGGTLAAPYAVSYVLERIDEVSGLIPDRLPWFTYWLLLAGLMVGGVILAITASKRFTQRQGG